MAKIAPWLRKLRQHKQNIPPTVVRNLSCPENLQVRKYRGENYFSIKMDLILAEVNWITSLEGAKRIAPKAYKNE